ncbi:MAG: response regulator transcription factor [Betaproteobacteria bacterium]|nr:response regulator transcription factor [Betaproteobacteria bacterium]
MTQAMPRLLVVDDDRFVLNTLVAGLSRAGFDVVVATNGDEAVRVAIDVRPALAILDVAMAGHNGLAVAESLAREARVPFMLLVSARDDEVRSRATSLGTLGFVSKPVDLAKLVPAIRSALARAVTLPKTGEGERLLADTLGGGHGPQALIAIGILAERHKVNCDEAVRMLHQRADSAGLVIDEMALTVIEQTESVNAPPV